MKEKPPIFKRISVNSTTTLDKLGNYGYVRDLSNATEQNLSTEMSVESIRLL